uniref:Bindin n=1 Tax=Parascaris univalens TaxID=6257 RepID=A0A915AZ13_PARUN
GGDVFGADKKKPAGGGFGGGGYGGGGFGGGGGGAAGGGIRAPDNQGAKAGTYDPNYQTLAGMGNEIFGGDKKRF